jgi:hypothetical protein
VLGTCAVGSSIQTVQADGSVTCRSAGTGDITGVIAGAGLPGGGNTGSVTINAGTAVLQSRVTGSCAVGSAIRAIAADGSVTCQTPALVTKATVDGVATLDAAGEAWIELPPAFATSNGDFRYQLTALGQPAPTLHVAKEIAGNRFQIGGGGSGQRISWQVAGTRTNASAQSVAAPVR